MKYAVELSRKAGKNLARISDDDYIRISSAIQNLGDFPRPVGTKKLVNTDFLRIRVGDFRIIYEVLDKQKIVMVHEVLHRKDAYRGI